VRPHGPAKGDRRGDKIGQGIGGGLPYEVMKYVVSIVLPYFSTDLTNPASWSHLITKRKDPQVTINQCISFAARGSCNTGNG
jgi:hypothetical protein